MQLVTGQQPSGVTVSAIGPSTGAHRLDTAVTETWMLKTSRDAMEGQIQDHSNIRVRTI